ncbi:toxin-antitoxin system YwqK family antitoxin [Myroides sp. LJL116]
MQTKILLLLLFWVCYSGSVQSQILDKQHYKGFVISNNNIDKAPELIRIDVVKNPLDTTFMLYDQNGKALNGEYHLIVNPTKHIELKASKGYIDGELKVFYYNVEQERYQLKKGIYHAEQSIFVTNEKYLADNGQITEYWLYYPNGQLQKHLKYTQEKINGPVTEYFQDGTIKSQKNYINGKLDGQVIQRDLTGNTELLTYNNDALHGPYQKNYVDGKLAQKGNYANNEKTGSWISYLPNGDIELEANYLNGRYHNEVIHYQKGKIYTQEQYDNGQLEGQKLVYSLGPGKLRLTQKEFYQNGKRQGTQNYYNSKEVLYLQVEYQDGVQVSSKEFDPISGALIGETLFKDNKSFAYKSYDKNGLLNQVQLRDENGNYVVVLEYSPKGEIIKKNTIFKGKPIVKLVEDQWGIIDLQ